MLEGAKKEGKITWYTSLIVDQVVRPVKEAFEKKYPFIQIEHFRGNSERIVQKMFAEYQGKRYEVDIMDGTVTAPMVKKGGYLQRFYSPHLADYPAELKDPQGYWGVSNVYYFAVGYNTRMVKPNEVPKTYEDLLNPRWKGQMMWSTSRGSGAPMMIGNILQTMGQEAGKGLFAKTKSAKHRQDDGEQPPAARSGHRRRISAWGCISFITTRTSVRPPARRWSGRRWNRCRRPSIRSRRLPARRIPTRRCFCSISSCRKKDRRLFKR